MGLNADAELPEDATSLHQATEQQLDEVAVKWTVPGPLHQVAFYPDNNAPEYFAYGGEQVPLSVWSLSKTLNHRIDHEFVSSPKETGDDENSTEITAGKKRRASSQSGKQKELFFGEIWRAKNLPNDSLSLTRHPFIRSIVFLPPSNVAPKPDNIANDLDAAIAVGTKDGIIRLYEPGKKISKHIHEWQIASKSQGAIRVLEYSLKDAILFVGDSARNLYVVDGKSGRLLFQYKGTSKCFTYERHQRNHFKSSHAFCAKRRRD